MNHLQQALENYNSESNLGYKLSLSLGIAFFDPEHSCSIEELIAQADKSMHERKIIK